MILRKCCICGRLVDGKGYDAKPFKNGICCASCNVKFVTEAKKNYKLKKRNY